MHPQICPLQAVMVAYPISTVFEILRKVSLSGKIAGTLQMYLRLQGWEPGAIPLF
jgi:hypothetical protein